MPGRRKPKNIATQTDESSACNNLHNLAHEKKSTTAEATITISDSRHRQIEVPLALWRSAHLRLSLLRHDDKGCGNVCTPMVERSNDKDESPKKASRALHIAYCEQKFWITLHAVVGKRHSQKRLEFSRAEHLNDLLAKSRQAILEAAASRHRAGKRAATDSSTTAHQPQPAAKRRLPTETISTTCDGGCNNSDDDGNILTTTTTFITPNSASSSSLHPLQ